MARESTGPQSAEKIKTLANQLRESAATLDAAVEAMHLLGVKELTTTHRNAIELGMRGVDGFCGAVRDALRTVSGPQKKDKKRVRSGVRLAPKPSEN